MSTIKKLDFIRLRNQELFQFFSQFKQLVEQFDPELLQIKPAFDRFLPQFEKLDIALEIIRKSDITQAMTNLDTHRDSMYKGLVDALKAASKHFNPEMVEAARKLNIVFNHFGDFTRLPYNEETGKIYNFVQELQTEKHAPLVAMLNLTAWVDELQSSNTEFDTLMQDRFLESSEKPELQVKAVRFEIETTYKEIAGDIEALYRIHKTTMYTDFMTKLNIQISYYSNILSQRKGRSEAKKEKNTEKAG